MANRENKISVILYEDTIDALIALPDESMSKVMKSILCRAKGQEAPELEALESVIFRLLYGQVERASNLSDERSKAGASKGKRASQAQTDGPDNQNVSNEMQTEATDKQIGTNSIKTGANVIKPEAKPNTSTSTSTSTTTVTNTSTITDISTSTSTEGAGEAEAASNVVYLPPEPELTGQTFEGNPTEEKSVEDICACWRKHIGGPPVPLYRLARSQLRDGTEAALICKGIEISAAAADKPMSYLPVILRNWRREGIQTLEAYEAAYPSGPPKTSGQYNRTSGGSSLPPPSYDLDEVDRLILEAQISGNNVI